MYDWPQTFSLRQELILNKDGRRYQANIEAWGPTFESAFLSGQIHFRLMLDQQGVDWRSVDPCQPPTPDPSEVTYPE